MMRIVAGKYRGRRLAGPRDPSLRATADRTREAVFNLLANLDPPLPAGQTVIDLFAGTGALGLEALSRGAEFTVFVERNRRALDVLTANIATLGVAEQTTIIRSDIRKPRPATLSADLAFLDPPYAQNLLAPGLNFLLQGQWLAPGAVLVLEMAKSDAITVPEGLAFLRERLYGHTRIVVLQNQ